MTLPLAKLTIVLGAGIIGSALAVEGGIPNVSDFFSGAFKIVKKLKQNDSSSSTSKPQNDSLLAQVNSLRQELQFLASNRSASVTIVSASGTGSGRYGIIIVIIAAGYGYIWWKGWKLPDLMFATRRNLSEASSKIAKQLETVYTSISATKRLLSSRIDRVDCNLDECAELTAATRVEVSELRGDMQTVGVDVQTVHHAVRTLETKISRIEGKQDLTNEGVRRLCNYAWSIENNRTTESIQAPPSSSRATLEPPPIASPSRSTSLTEATLLLEPPSPSSSDGTHKKHKSLQSAVSASGLKELSGISEALEISSTSSESSTESPSLSEERNVKNNGSVSSSVLRRKFSGLNAFVTRTQSTKNACK